MLGNVL